MGQRMSRDAFVPAKSSPARIGQQGTWRPREQVTKAPTVGSARAGVKTQDIPDLYDANAHSSFKRRTSSRRSAISTIENNASSKFNGYVEIDPIDIDRYLDLPLRVSAPPDDACKQRSGRWMNVYPHRVNRVNAEDVDSSVYLNASWVRSFSSESACEYIACEVWMAADMKQKETPIITQAHKHPCSSHLIKLHIHSFCFYQSELSRHRRLQICTHLLP